MTLTVCWSTKGGSGTTVVAACLALESPRSSVLVDLDGEMPLVLGVPDPLGQGLADWFQSQAPASAVLDLAVAVDGTTQLVPRGSCPIARDAPRWRDLGRWLAASEVEYVVDAGVGEPPALLLDSAADLDRHRSASDPTAVRSLLVIRPCYLALTRAGRMRTQADGVVLVDEPGRRLGIADVERSTGAPVIARMPLDPAVGRAIDSGLVVARLPGGVRRAMLRATNRRAA